MINYLFVYGTLMKYLNNEHSEFLSANSKFIGKGSFNGLLFEIDYYPGAIYIPKIQYRVFGNLFEINSFNDVIDKLDNYEEVGGNYPEPNEYIRKIIPINQVNGKEILCWTYLYNLGLFDKTWISSGDYLGHVNEKLL